MKQEFDKYIENYREDLSDKLWLSGESSVFFAEYKAKKLKEWFSQKQFGNILDFGCGDGVMTNFVSRQFPESFIYGVDPSPKSIKQAEKYKHIMFSCNSDQDTKLKFDDNFFDLIYAAGAFHHIPFSMHADYLKELLRILKPNSSAVLFELNPLNPLTTYTFKHNPIDYDARMLTPWYAYKLASRYGNARIMFYCFYPKSLSFLRFTEKYMTKVPFSALYAIILEKEKK